MTDPGRLTLKRDARCFLETADEKQRSEHRQFLLPRTVWRQVEQELEPVLDADVGVKRGAPTELLELVVGQELSLRERGGRYGRTLCALIERVEMNASGRRARVQLRVLK
jgi:hypothetical protein